MPPAIAANTICSDTAMPETVSGIEIHEILAVACAPPSAVSAALMTVTRIFSRITLMPIDGGGVLVLGDRLERLAADAAVDPLPDRRARPARARARCT